MPTPVTISLPGEVSPSLASELAEDLGTYPLVEHQGGERGVGEVAHVAVFATIAILTGGMLEAFGTSAVERLMRAMQRLRQSARLGDADIRLVDEINQIVVVLDRRTAGDERAIRSLLAQERDVFKPQVELHWNAAVGRWQASMPSTADSAMTDSHH